MNENQREAIEKVAMLTGEAKEILEELLDASNDDKISNAINAAFVYFGDIAGNMWAIATDTPEDIYEL